MAICLLKCYVKNRWSALILAKNVRQFWCRLCTYKERFALILLICKCSTSYKSFPTSCFLEREFTLNCFFYKRFPCIYVWCLGSSHELIEILITKQSKVVMISMHLFAIKSLFPLINQLYSHSIMVVGDINVSTKITNASIERCAVWGGADLSSPQWVEWEKH